MTSLSGTKPYFLDLRINLSAARLFLLVWTRIKNFTLGIHGAPEVNQATIDLDIDFVEMPVVCGFGGFAQICRDLGPNGSTSGAPSHTKPPFRVPLANPQHPKPG